MRHARRLAVLALAALALSACGDESGGGGAPAEKLTGFQGRFRAKTEKGTLVLSLDTNGDVVDVTMNGQTVKGRLTAPNRVEGSEYGDDGGGSFVFTLAGDRLTA